MPLDAISLRAVVEELRPELLGLRIEKVQQPSRDQIILLLRGNRRLLINAGANAPRIQLTKIQRDNPAEPPMFCMLLRKHLVGAKIAEITQPPLERLVKMELDIIDDFGQPGKRTLVLEAMGRRSNLILLDGEGRILDCMRRFGRVALLGCTRNSDFSIDYYRKVHGPGITLVGAHTQCRPPHDSAPGWWTEQDDREAIMNLYRMGRLHLEQLIEETHSPEEAPKVYTRLATEK